MAAGGKERRDGVPCVSLGCATGAALAVEACEDSLPHCTRALLAPQDVLGHKDAALLGMHFLTLYRVFVRK